MQGPVHSSDQRLVSSVCTLCALACDSQLALTKHCTRRKRWLESLSAGRRATELDESFAHLTNILVDTETLIWLDSCDVQTARAAVVLAKQTGATIHVGQSTGSHAVKSVMSNAGWFGTTLSEVAARARLIVTLGDGALRESPLLAERFFRSQTQLAAPRWLHISAHPSSVSITNEAQFVPHGQIHWPRENWFEQLSSLALAIQQPSSQLIATAVTDFASSELLTQLRTAEQIVWIWDIDDLHFATDELIVRRLLSIANSLNEAGRCSLLPLDMNIGRVTAEETLLWLTGCPGTACWQGGRWHCSPRYSGYSLEQWSAAFSKIILISNLPCDRSLPNLPATVTLHARPAVRPGEIQVAGVGIECSGHLFRGDRGTVHFAQAAQSGELPTASHILNRLTQRASSARAVRVHHAG